MLDFKVLKQMFFDHYPGFEHARVLKASEDSAVGQFRGHKNSIGFLPLITCPGATYGPEGCAETCYGRHGRAAFNSCINVLASNTYVLIDHIQRGAVRQLTDQLVMLMNAAYGHYLFRLNNAHGKEKRRLEKGPTWRYQWDGDLMHRIHAEATRRSAEQMSFMDTWLYTRSFDLLGYLEPKPANLTVWLSVDPENENEAKKAQKKYPWAKAAVLKEYVNVQEGDIICPKLRYREGEDATVLPTPLACDVCRICTHDLDKVPTIVFPKKIPRAQIPISNQILQIVSPRKVDVA